MAMSFAERMKARQAELAAGKATTPLVAEPTPAPAPVAAPAPTPEPSGLLARLKAKATPSPTAPTPTAAPTTTKEVEPLPKIIQAFNALNKEKPTTLGESLSGMPPEEAVIRIQQRIQDMSELEDGTAIRLEMEHLSDMLLANPSACLYLLDGDLGLCVRALRKMTNNRVAADMGRAKTTKKASTSLSKPLSAADIQAALDDL